MQTIDAILIPPRRREAKSQPLLALAVVFATLLGVGCAPAQPQPQALHPASSEALAADASLAQPPYLRVKAKNGAALLVLGTVHLGPTAGWRFSPQIEAGLEEASGFVMELDLHAVSDDQVGSLLADLVLLKPGQKIEDVVSPETAKLLDENDALLAQLGLPANARTRFKPWYIAASLIQMAAVDSGYDLTKSAENALLSRIGDAPLLALESVEGQLGLMDTLPPAAQDAMLRDTLARLDDAVSELKRLVEAWRASDRSELLAISRQGIDEIPGLEAFYDRLLKERNHNWVRELGAILEDPERKDETTFVAVGALHLAGEDGLENLFAEAGYHVVRIH